LASDQKALRSDFEERLASIPTQDAGYASWGVNRDPEESVRLFVEANQFEVSEASIFAHFSLRKSVNLNLQL
jgi:hypothetical protein